MLTRYFEGGTFSVEQRKLSFYLSEHVRCCVSIQGTLLPLVLGNVAAERGTEHNRILFFKNFYVRYLFLFVLSKVRSSGPECLDLATANDGRPKNKA